MVWQKERLVKMDHGGRDGPLGGLLTRLFKIEPRPCLLIHVMLSVMPLDTKTAIHQVHKNKKC